MLIDLTGSGVTGKDRKAARPGEHHREQEYHPEGNLSPMVGRGVRIGTPAVTTRGMREAEMVEIADLIAQTIRNGEAALPAVKARVEALCARFPLYENDVWA